MLGSSSETSGCARRDAETVEPERLQQESGKGESGLGGGGGPAPSRAGGALRAEEEGDEEEETEEEEAEEELNQKSAPSDVFPIIARGPELHAVCRVEPEKCSQCCVPHSHWRIPGFSPDSPRILPRPPWGVICCSLLSPLETYQSSLLGKKCSQCCVPHSH